VQNGLICAPHLMGIEAALAVHNKRWFRRLGRRPGLITTVTLRNRVGVAVRSREPPDMAAHSRAPAPRKSLRWLTGRLFTSLPVCSEHGGG